MSWFHQPLPDFLFWLRISNERQLPANRQTPGSRYRTCSWYLLLKTSFLLLFRRKVYMNFSLLSERSALEKEGKEVKNVVAMLSSLCNTWVVHVNWSYGVISFMKLMHCCCSLSVLLWIPFFLRVFKGPKFFVIIISVLDAMLNKHYSILFLGWVKTLKDGAIYWIVLLLLL